MGWEGGQMPDATDWLPGLEYFADYDNNWDRYCEALYAIFKADFVDGKPTFSSHTVRLKRHPMEQGKEATFWHFTSEGEDEATRTPDFRRCERIRWPKAMMEAFDEQPDPTGPVLWWKEKRRSEWRYVLAPSDFSYKMIVAIRTGFVLPWTAYPVEPSHSRRKMKKAFEGYWEQQK